MHRLIVTSATYRQSSRSDRAGPTADPENPLLWRQNRQRLDGEAIRDSLLAVSGRLNRAMGGPVGFSRAAAGAETAQQQGSRLAGLAQVEDRERRSLYVFVRRNLRYPFFEVFDRPDTNASCPQRPVTTIAPQALSPLEQPVGPRRGTSPGGARCREAARIATSRSNGSRSSFSVVRPTPRNER